MTVVIGVFAVAAVTAAGDDRKAVVPQLADGYRGVWYMNQPQPGPYKFKYSGGLATYPQQHAPIAIHSKAAGRTYFCFGSKTGGANRISNVVSYFDHAGGTVPRPRVLLSRGTNDLHYNPSLSVDDAGFIYVFANSHGVGGELAKTDPTHGKSYVFRSREPHSIDAFETVYEGNFSYSQPWLVEDRGLLWLHTRYEQGKRRLYYISTADGRKWSEPKRLARIKSGDYQISWSDGKKVGTAFDHHPDKGGLNARTNIYYLQTSDFGASWTTAAGKGVELPVTETDNPGLVHDFEKEGLLVYLKDLDFDENGRPVILYLTTKGHKSGPESGPRVWETMQWTGEAWLRRRCFESDHNYDHGSLYLEPNGVWRIVAPIEPGPQPFSTGGAIAIMESADRGLTWRKVKGIEPQNGRNQTYVRRPWRAADGFMAFWADGDALNSSESDLFFADRDGTTFRLPRTMSGESAKPERVGPPVRGGL